MKEGSYQFIHVDAYGREGSIQTKTSINKHGAKVTTTTKSRSAKEILAEQWREEGACPHIKNPSKPGLLYGIPPLEVLSIINEWAVFVKVVVTVFCLKQLVASSSLFQGST